MEVLERLIGIVRRCCEGFPYPRRGDNGSYAMADFGLAAFLGRVLGVLRPEPLVSGPPAPACGRARPLQRKHPVRDEPHPRGSIGNFVCVGRAVAPVQAMARVKRSPKRMANWALAMHHSRAGMVHSFSDRFKTRKRSFRAASSVGK